MSVAGGKGKQILVNMCSGEMYSSESEYAVRLSLSHMLLTKRSQTQKGFVVLSYLYRMGEKVRSQNGGRHWWVVT